MGTQYLIDTDILIDFFKRKYALDNKFKAIGLTNCFISEISIAELTYGALKSSNIDKQLQNVEKVKAYFQTLPISDVIIQYSHERLRLEKLGTRLPDFDLLIALTSVVNELILVTGNEKHHQRVQGVTVENWRNKQFNEFL